MITRIPQPVVDILKALQRAGFEAYIVGGCVRDLILGRAPKDWDITTNALPEQIQAIFPDSFYENDFGTVGVKTTPFLKNGDSAREHDIIEVTTYRTESDYSDKRRPDNVSFVTNLEEDLKRRDFTMNAIALSVDNEGKTPIVDPFNGQKDLEDKVIRAVGDPNERFQEDALRLMRAVRFYSELRTTEKLASKEPLFDTGSVPPMPLERRSNSNDWHIDPATLSAIQKNAVLITHISWERIRDEFSRIILSTNPAEGVDLLQKTGLLKHILPELEEGLDIGQNLHHVYTVYEHNLRALKTCPSAKLDVRLATLLHDVAKPRTKRGNGYRSTFYNHDHVGARMTRPILTRLRYPAKIIDKATMLVDNHLFYYNVGEVTEASVRRLIKRVGLENIPDLMDVRVGDRLGSGTPKAKPYRLRHLEYMIDKVSDDPISAKMLAINGSTLMEELGLNPGPKIGAILDVLLAEVIEDPSRNTRDALLARAKELENDALETLRKRAKSAIEERREEDDRKIKKRHWVE